jgi:hypothetical protein
MLNFSVAIRNKKPWDKWNLCNWISKKPDVWTGFFWLRLRQGIAFSPTPCWTLSFHNGRRFLYHVRNIIWQAKNSFYYTVVNKNSKTFFTMWCVTALICFSIIEDIFSIKKSV